MTERLHLNIRLDRNPIRLSPYLHIQHEDTCHMVKTRAPFS